MELKRLCGEGKLSRESQVCAEGTQSWQPLFTVIQAPAGAILAASNQPQLSRIGRTKPCPMCGEQVLTVAKKCKHCGDYLDGSPTRSHTAASDVPELWNPTAAVNWSIIFVPLGAYLHFRNDIKLKRHAEAKQNFIWFCVLLLSPAIHAFISCVMLGDHNSIYKIYFSLFGLVILPLFGWYFGSAKRQINYVNESFGEDYQRKSWVMPLILCSFLWFVTYTVLFGFGILTIFMKL